MKPRCLFRFVPFLLGTDEGATGGGVDPHAIKHHVPVPLSFRDFFSGATNFRGLAVAAIANSRIKSTSDRATRGWIRVFILSMPEPGGGVSKVYDNSRRQPRWCHAHKIFGAGEALKNQSEIKTIKRAPGGGQMSGTLRCGTGGQAHKFGRAYCREHFFWKASVSFFAAKFRWGG